MPEFPPKKELKLVVEISILAQDVKYIPTILENIRGDAATEKAELYLTDKLTLDVSDW